MKFHWIRWEFTTSKIRCKQTLWGLLSNEIVEYNHILCNRHYGLTQGDLRIKHRDMEVGNWDGGRFLRIYQFHMDLLYFRPGYPLQ